MSSAKRILVTGGTGLLGRHLLNRLSPFHEIHAVVRAQPEVPIPNVTYHRIDLASGWEIEALPREIDVVVHLAQSSHFRDFPEQALDIFRVNVEATAKLLAFARAAGVKKFIFASSGGVYGNGPAPFRENAPIVAHDKLGYYLGSKLCAEVLIQPYAALMDVFILRIFFMYGAGQKRTMLIPRLVDSVRDGRPIILHGENGIRINPVHVSDAVRTIKSCLSLSGSRTLNVAGPEILSIKEIAELIGGYLGKKPAFRHETGDQADLVGDNSEMMALINDDLVRLRSGIADVLGDHDD